MELDILNILNLYGWHMLFFIIPLIIVYIILERWIHTGHAIGSENSGAESPIERIKIKELSQHPLFTALNYRHTIEIPNLTICPNMPVRQELFRIIIGQYVKHLYNRSKYIVNDEHKLNTLSNTNWNELVTNTYILEMSKFTNRLRLLNVPPILISKFNDWQKDSTKMLLDYVNTISTYDIYDGDNFMRTVSLFWVVNILITATIADAEHHLRALNGELSGIKFNGNIIE